jgi:hypothetical protein
MSEQQYAPEKYDRVWWRQQFPVGIRRRFGTVIEVGEMSVQVRPEPSGVAMTLWQSDVAKARIQWKGWKAAHPQGRLEVHNFSDDRGYQLWLYHNDGSHEVILGGAGYRSFSEIRTAADHWIGDAS